MQLAPSTRPVPDAPAIAAAPMPHPSAGIAPMAPPAPPQAPAAAGGTSWFSDVAGGLLRGSGRKDSVLETVAKSAARSIGSTVGREIIRGVLGNLLGSGSRRR